MVGSRIDHITFVQCTINRIDILVSRRDGISNIIHLNIGIRLMREKVWNSQKIVCISSHCKLNMAWCSLNVNEA
jgi:hypothetical protein